MRELRPNYVSKLVKFSPAAVDCLARNGQTGDAYIHGGITQDGSVGWLARGAALEVFSCQNSQRLAAWCFGAALKDQQTVITCVTEYAYDNGTKLLVATATPNSESSLLSVFDVKTSRIFKSIEIPYQVSALQSITHSGGEQEVGSLLSEHLRCFCGVVAVGTLQGHIYLLDMCIDDESEDSDEVRPNGILFLDPRTGDVTTKRYNAMTKRKHLCLEVDEESHGRGYFYFRKPDGSVIKTHAEGEVEVTSFAFVKQAGTLAVGYSFGCFQLWRLSIPVLEYSSRYEDGLEAVTHFTYQEPENDPRNFAYLWVARGPLPDSSIEEGTSTISLFQLGYNNKHTHEHLGHIFEELTSVCLRFDHVLTDDPMSTGEEDLTGSRLISCFTIRDVHQSHALSAEEDSFESMSGPDQSLCTFVWEAAATDPHSKSIYRLGIFDINRWYHAQMPFSIRAFRNTLESCNFFAFYSLGEVADAIGSDNLMALNITYDSLCHYNSCILPAPEQHFFPSALAFEAVCVAETGVVGCKCLGAQRQILSNMERQGPSVLLEPRDTYNMCLSAGLLPRNVDVSLGNVSLAQKRDAVLTVALDHNMVNFLATCVQHFTSQEYVSSGCSLRSLLDWAWSRVGFIKESLDRLCVSLYDWSGVCLDMHTLHVLHQYHKSLLHLVSVFELLASQSGPSTLQGQKDLQAKVGVVTLISQHLQMVLWFHGVGLLPERSEEDEMGENDYCYPGKLLRDKYTVRRQEIQRINRDLRSTDLLLIDGLLDEMGATVQHLLEKEGGNGLYPPPSFHAVVNLYLLEGIPVVAKHTAVLYLLFDLMHLEENTDLMPERVGSFLSTFNISQSLAKLVQGLWSIDHKRFDDAMLLLLDPSIKSDLVQWQHMRIIKSLLYQNSSKLALKYMRIKRLPLQTPEDVKLRLTVLLANGLTAEAYEYQKVCRDQLSGDDLLSHLFLACHQTKTVDRLLQLPMQEEEKHRLVDYLKTTQEAHSSELLLLHLLQRSRFIEAVRLNNRLKSTGAAEVDAASRERAAARNAIVDCYFNVLPKVQRKLAFGPEQLPRKPTQTRREVVRPAPLSSVVNRVQRSQAVTQATLINSVMNKVHEVTEEMGAGPSSSQPSTPTSDPLGPFTCTPVTPSSKKPPSDFTELVYASASKRSTEHSMAFVASPMKAKPSSPLSGIPYGDSVRLSDAAKRRMSRYYSAEALSLLQTPPVRRKSLSKAPAPSSPTTTPQSILKVRTQARRSPSPREFLKAKLAAELKLPTPPRFTRRTLLDLTPAESAASSVAPEPPSVAPSTTASTSSSLPGTPKQLRFSVPASPESPVVNDADSVSVQEESEEPVAPAEQEDMEEMDYERPSPRPPLRSARDRSPTPERMSPKLSPKTDFLPRRDLVQATERSAEESTEEEEVVLEAVTVAPAAGERHSDRDAEDDMPTEEAITFNFDRSRDVLNTEEQEEMETDDDTEPWVGTVKSIQSQSAEDSLERDKHDSGRSEEEEDEEREEPMEKQRDEKESNELEEGAADEMELRLEESDAEVKDSDEQNHDVQNSVEETYSVSKTVVHMVQERQTRVTQAEVTGSGDGLQNKVEAEGLPEPEVDDAAHAQDEPDSTTGRVTPEDHAFKTPPRPVRLSVMPPTPPESGQGTPPQQPSPGQSRSRETSPVSTTSKEVTITRKSRLETATLSTRVTRSSSRSLSPAEGQEHQKGDQAQNEAQAKQKPKNSPKQVDEAGDSEAIVGQSTPTRRSKKNIASEAEKPRTPRRGTRSSERLEETPPSSEQPEAELTPSRRTRGSVAKAAKAAELTSGDGTAPATPRKATLASAEAAAPDTLSRRTRGAKLNSTLSSTPSPSEKGEIAKTKATPVRRGRSFKETSEGEEAVRPSTPRRGRSSKDPSADTSAVEPAEPSTPTRRGKSSKPIIPEVPSRTPRKLNVVDDEGESEGQGHGAEGHRYDLRTPSTPMKATESFRSAEAETMATRNTPRRSPSRRVKAPGDAETPEPGPSRPVRRTPSRRCKVQTEEPDVDASFSLNTVSEESTKVRQRPAGGVRRSPSRRVKAVIDEEAVNRALSQMTAEAPSVEERRKSPSRRRGKPELVVTAAEATAREEQSSSKEPEVFAARVHKVAERGAYHPSVRVEDQFPERHYHLTSGARTSSTSTSGLKSEFTTRTVDAMSTSSTMEVATLGPLSADSFMMTMRTKGDSTPDSLVPPDLPSESSSVSVEEEKPQFTFSDPIAVDPAQERGAVGHSQDVKSFIFSPPLTRTRRRQSTDLLESSHGILPPPADTAKPTKAKKSMKRKGVEDKVKLLTPPTSAMNGDDETSSQTPASKSKRSFNLFKKRKAMRLLAPKSKS